MPKRTLQFDDGQSCKFWTISLKGVSQTITFGRIGTTGQTRVKEFATVEEARMSYNRIIRQKISSGYVDAKDAAVIQKKSVKKNQTKRTFAKKSNSFWKPLKKQVRDKRPLPTTSLIKAREKALGIRFPAALLKLFRQQNGGDLVHPEFLVSGQVYELTDIPPINGIDSLAVGYADHLALVEGNLRKPELIFPLCGDGHCFLAMDYRKVGPLAEPEIIYLDIEGHVSCKKVADSFAEFLSGQQTGKQKLAVSFNEIDPTALIGEVDIKTTHKAIRETEITYQARLCLTDKQIVLYTYERWDQPRKPSVETWDRAILALRELNPDFVKIEDIGGYFAIPTKTLYIHANLHLGGVFGVTSERKGLGGWKNLPFDKLGYIKLTTTDITLLKKCRAKILKAYRKQEA